MVNDPTFVTDGLDDSRAGEVRDSAIAIIFVTVLVLLLRLVSRWIAKAGFWWDDYTMIVALPLALTLPVLNVIGVECYDFGKHQAVARPGSDMHWWKSLYIHENFYAPSLALIKLSILLFYARIFPGQRFRRLLCAIGAVVLLWWICCQLVVILECLPIRNFWTPVGPLDGCINVSAFFIGQAVPNIVTDLVLLIVPLPLIWRLQLPLAQKMGLIAIFTLGGFVTLTSIVRLTLLLDLQGGADDITYDYAPVAIWSAMEPNIGVICASLPMCRPILRLLLNKALALRKVVFSNGGHGTNITQTSKIPAFSKHTWPAKREGDIEQGGLIKLADMPAREDKSAQNWTSLGQLPENQGTNPMSTEMSSGYRSEREVVALEVTHTISETGIRDEARS